MHVIERILKEILRVMVDEGPHRHCLVFDVVLVSFTLVVTHKGTILACVYLNCDKSEHSLIEFEHRGHLYVNHSYKVQKLDENGASLLVFVVPVVVTEPSSELMPERQPLLLD